MKTKILSIGDIHGRDSWKFLTHGSSYEYDTWRTAVDHGAPVVDDFWKELPYMNFDKIIFVGDYVDSFSINNLEIKANLLDIIHFKKALGDKVVLLTGNHDVQYIVPNQICSGYRPEMKHDFGKIFEDNIDLFTLAYEVKTIDGKSWLWTHAGVTSGWYERFLNLLDYPVKKTHQIFLKDHDFKNSTVAENLNLAWSLRMEILFDVDSYSGGYKEWAGPVWVRPTIFNRFPLKGYNQVVGHTRQRGISFVGLEILGEDTEHCFIDCLENDQTGLELEIEIA